MIKTVIFDFVNTIAFLKPLKEDILIEYCQKENSVLLSRRQVEKVYVEVDDALPYSSVNIGTANEKKIFYDQYNELLFNKLGMPGSKEFYDFYNSVEKHWVLDKPVLELFKHLKSKQISIGIISNFDNNLESVLEGLKIEKMLDFVAISAKIGLEKPDIELYKYAKKVYNIDVNTTIYVGDSYNLDYIPSKEAGFTSFLIDRGNNIAKKANKLQNLNEIIQMVGDVTQPL